MADDLIEFEWGIPEYGFEWISACSDDQENHPGPPDPDASETEKRRHKVLLRLAKPRTYLVEVHPPRGNPRKVRTTRPMDDLEGRLHRVFAAVTPDENGIRQFANDFGCLGCDIQETVDYGARNEPNCQYFKTNEDGSTSREISLNAACSGENLENWKKEIKALNAAIKLWDLIREENRKSLKDHIEWTDRGVFLKGFSGINTRIADRRWMRQTYECFEHDKILEPAKFALIRAIDEHLLEPGRAAPALLYHVKTRKLGMHIVPKGLIGAIWLEFANAINGNIPYRKCEECGGTFAVPRKGGRKRFCSDSCRVINHRKSASKRGTRP